MITEDFYPAEWSDDRMDYSPTELVQSIPITTPEFTQAYWLGWRAWKNVPQQYHISRYDGGTFTDVTKPENVPVGFTVCDAGSYNINYRFSQLLTNNGEKWKDITSCYFPYAATLNTRLPNSLNINTTLWGVLHLQFYGLAYVGADIVEITANVTVTLEQLLNKETIFATFSNPVGTQQINLEDFTEHSIAEYISSGSVPYKIVLGMYTLEYARDVSKTGQAIGYQCPRPMLQIHTTDNKPYIEAITIPVNYNNTNNFGWGSGTYGNGFFMNYDGSIRDGCVRNEIGGTVDIMGGYVGSIDFSAITTDTKTLNVFGNFYCRGLQRSDYFIVGRVFTLDEIIKSITLLPRYNDSTGTNTYANAGYLYSKVDLQTNEFLPEFVAGTDTALLTDWQLLNGITTDDDFTKDRIPEYVPEPGDEEENTGDKITRPASIGVGGTNGFVTQYALNRSDVAQLGALLWTSFVDQDYWQNYLFSLALDTGTFQLSGLLNFFVSLKVYPFPLINIDSFSQWGADMYIGTGIVPLHFNNNLHVINNYCDYISGGHIDIPRYFNDYRDYINTEISLYLPFCGTVQLNPGDVIGNRIDIEYAIDFASGGCIAYVDLTTGDGAGYPVGALPGQIGADIPLTATAAGEVAARFIGDGLNVAGMIGGEVSRTASGVAGALGGNPSGGSGGGSMFAGVAGMYGGAGAAMAADLAPGLARQGLQMLQRGSVGAPMLSGGRGFAAFGAPSKPYVQIRRGIYPEVSGLGTVSGLPAAGTYTIGSLSGFVQGDAKVDGLSCPDSEKQKIRALLASGIYV